jgi:beta-phosphoglucomutase-like phosphatase (HAD superfamily)
MGTEPGEHVGQDVVGADAQAEVPVLLAAEHLHRCVPVAEVIGAARQRVRGSAGDVQEMLGLGDDLFAGVCIAPERPDEPVVYRKPSPRFIQEMLAEHGFAAEAAWMVGDAPSDWEAGLNAGIRSAAIVANAAAEAARDQRLALGIEAYASLHEWATAVFG